MSDRLRSVMSALNVSPDRATKVAGALSGAHVVPVTQSNGSPAILKFTAADRGCARHAAERELRFYLELQPRIRVNTPRLLAHHEDDDTIAILLTRHAAPRPAGSWSQQNWTHLASDLAALHETQIRADDGWRRTSTLTVLPSDPDIDATRAFWSWPGEPPFLESIIEDLRALHESIQQPRQCFLHGDCHTDNVLVDRGRLVWVDWQGAGLGDPAAELAFPSIRATPTGAAPPNDTILQIYAQLRGLNATTLKRAVLAAELAIFLFSWPPYAAYNSDIGIERVHRRVRNLALAWLTSS